MLTLTPYLRLWQLQADGLPITTHSSELWPVQWQGKAAMLKLAHTAEEQRGHELMQWYGGIGAAEVYAHEGAALLLERLDSAPSLHDMALSGQDAQATRILCAAAAQLHCSRPQPWPALLPLDVWFASLKRAAVQGGVWQECWTVAQELLVTQQDIRPLHGDLHHDNIMPRHETQEWCAIDPKGLLGERGYDYANLFYNPHPDPANLQRLAIVADLAQLEPTRLLAWIAAYGGLSAAWFAEDGEAVQAQRVLDVAQVALHLRSG